MEEPLLLQHRDDRGVVTLTLNRPQAFNALSEAMLAALGEAIDALAKDEEVRVVVLGLVTSNTAPSRTNRYVGRPICGENSPVPTRLEKPSA